MVKLIIDHCPKLYALSYCWFYLYSLILHFHNSLHNFALARQTMVLVHG